MKDECGNCYEAQYAALGCKWSSAPQCAFAGMCCVDGNCGGSLPEASYGFRDMTSVCWGGETLLLGHSREPLLVASTSHKWPCWETLHSSIPCDSVVPSDLCLRMTRNKLQTLLLLGRLFVSFQVQELAAPFIPLF